MNAAKAETKKAISARLQRTVIELRELEKLIRSSDIDSRVLEEFSAAVDRIRLAASGIRAQSSAVGRRDLV